MIVKIEKTADDIRIYNQNKSHDYRVPLSRTDILSKLKGHNFGYFHAQILNGEFIIVKEVSPNVIDW